MRVGFVGLGSMGKPMATNLVKAGFDVTVVNRSRGKVQELVALGATAGTTPAAVAAEVDVVMTSLLGVEAVELVITGPGGVLEGAAPGLLLVDLSSLPIDVSRGLVERCAAAGVTYLDAPVAGTDQMVWDGELTVMVGGDRSAFERVLPVLEVVGRTVQHVGPAGSGQIAKLLNNMVKDIHIAGLMEGLVLGAALGLEPGGLHEVMRSALATSRQLHRVGPRIIAGDFSKINAVSGNVADAARVQALASSVGLPLPVHAAVQALWQRALDAGLGAEDTAAAVKVLERVAGVEVRGS